MRETFNFGVGSTPTMPSEAFPTGLPMDAGLMAEMLEPRLVERPAPCPAIRVPRVVRRTYTHGDLCVAADLLAKLRRRDDQRPLAERTCPVDPDAAIDVAVDRLLRVL